ncbi:MULTISPECIES: hypothetical protein [unclassified Micromonospora]|uniref:hypothetical protein n=1 Tax=unclassified Micromonospora TaxID=2617518 RepID=UPI003323C317
MTSRKPFAAAPIDDENGRWLGYVRYDGDPDVFTALAWSLGIREGWEHSVQPPTPQLLRVNPDWTGEYAWHLVRADHRGPGVFVGAVIEAGCHYEPSWLAELREVPL